MKLKRTAAQAARIPAAKPSGLRRALGRGARKAAKHIDSVPILRELVLPSICAAIYVMVNSWLHLFASSNPSQILGGIGAAAAGYVLTSRLRMRGYSRAVKQINKVANSTVLSPGRDLYVQMVQDRVNAASAVVHGFQLDRYVVDSPEQLQQWIGTFFSLSEGSYTGIDSHIPSQYWKDYRWFLDAHADSLEARRARGRPSDDVRVIAVSSSELDDDWYRPETNGGFLKFVEWHQDHNVELRTLTPQALEEIRRALSMDDEQDDVALWQSFGVLFTSRARREGHRVAIRLRASDDLQSVPNFGKLQQFMAEVRSRSTLMKEAIPSVEMGDAKLVAAWNSYIAPELRWQTGGPYSQLLTSVIPTDASIFDAAAGSGVDSVHLLELGYSVTSNEVDPRLGRQARDYASRRKVDIELRNARWETLSLAGNPRFDAVLVLGNSLCLVASQDRRRGALKAFHRVLRPGGTLLIDERNFELMRRRADEITHDPLSNWVDSVPDVMYPGRTLVGFPQEISDTSVTWAFASNEPAATSPEELRRRADEYHPLQLHAFAHGEMFELLQQTGFEVLGVFADLTRIAGDDDNLLVVDKMPSYESTADSGFLTYVARRPPS